MVNFTIKKASQHLKALNLPYAPITIRKAITDNKLKATLRTDTPTTFYEIEEEDLLAWAKDPMQHKPGRKTDQKE